MARIEQKMGLIETHTTGSQSNLEILSVPKPITVGTFANTRFMFADERHKNYISYKAALILTSTAEEMNYHDGLNKPVTMIMVRSSFFHATH